MDTTTIELMEEHVRDIYRAVTGSELPSGTETLPEVSIDELASRFADLESRARRNPAVADRVPPFSFSPPLDVVTDEHQIVLELAVPGVQSGEVVIQVSGDFVSISGVRGGERGPHDCYLHAEIPRGPFYRLVQLPVAVEQNPIIEVEHGLIRVRLALSADVAKTSDVGEQQGKQSEESKNGSDTDSKS